MTTHRIERGNRFPSYGALEYSEFLVDPVRRYVKVDQAPTDGLGGGVAEQAFGGRVPPGYPALHGLRDDGVARIFDDGEHARLLREHFGTATPVDPQRPAEHDREDSHRDDQGEHCERLDLIELRDKRGSGARADLPLPAEHRRHGPRHRPWSDAFTMRRYR